MTESIYKEYENKYYNPDDNDKKPGDNDNWKSLQKGFYEIGHTQVETTEGLTLGKGEDTETSISDTQLANVKAGKFNTLTLGTGTAGETSLSAEQLANIKAGEFSTLKLGTGTADETTLSAAQLANVKAGEFTSLTLGTGTEDETTLTVVQLKALLALLQ